MEDVPGDVDPPSDEEEVEEEGFHFRRQNAMDFSKLRGSPSQAGSDEDEDDLEGPNLSEYLDYFGLSIQERIALCRAYASYLASIERIHSKNGPDMPAGTRPPKRPRNNTDPQ